MTNRNTVQSLDCDVIQCLNWYKFDVLGVAEPVSYYISPPIGQGSTEQSAKAAMQYVYLHWGVSAWACYALVGVALGYFQFRKTTIFTQLCFLSIDWGSDLRLCREMDQYIGDVIRRHWYRHIISFGTLQVNSGMNYLWGLPISIYVQIGLIVIITVVYIASTISGLQGAIKHLSNLNIILARINGIYLSIWPNPNYLKSFIPRYWRLRPKFCQYVVSHRTL